MSGGTRHNRRSRPRGRSLVGERHVVEVGPVAHGGHCVARHEGRVVFVRHALPGERVVAEVTEGEAESRFLRADAVEVLRAAPDRVTPPCPFAGPGRCGGCDFQHVAPPAQRDLKAAVVREQLSRLAGIDVPVVVEAVAPDDLGWRTRVQLAADRRGRLGLHKHRSHEIEVVDRCLIAAPSLPPVTERRWPGRVAVEALRSSTGEELVLERRTPRGPWEPEDAVLHEEVLGHRFRVSGSGFWQVHPAAPAVLVEAVLAALEPAPGDRVLDLYAGAGLFSRFLADRVGAGGTVLAVEGDRTAVADAEANLAGLPQVSVHAGSVDRVLGAEDVVEPWDLVVLDPPRVGARRAVVEAVAARTPRAVAYVACDPGALARDVAVFAERGYALDGLRAFDLFPMTHHVECVALLTRTRP